MDIVALHEVGAWKAQQNGGGKSGENEYPGWTLIEFTVDSGATETVMGVSQLSQVPLQRSSTSHGAKYEVANGAIIENQGERRFIGVCFDCEGNTRGVARRITAQVCDVNKALLSVGRLEAAGYEVKFGGRGKVGFATMRRARR